MGQPMEHNDQQQYPKEARSQPFNMQQQMPQQNVNYQQQQF